MRILPVVGELQSTAQPRQELHQLKKDFRTDLAALTVLMKTMN